jgi:hypothetical protein
LDPLPPGGDRLSVKTPAATGNYFLNLLVVATRQEALDRIWEAGAPPPRVGHSCYQQCYIEPSLMQARPATLAWELLPYPEPEPLAGLVERLMLGGRRALRRLRSRHR